METATKANPAIPLALSTLMSNVDNLDSSIGKYLEKTAPVRKQIADAPCNPIPCTPCDCELAAKILTAADKIQGLCSVINRAANNTEL